MKISRRDRTTPADLLRSLPEPTVALPGDTSTQEVLADDLRRAELRRSVLTIAELNHSTEIALVRAAAAKASGEASAAGGVA
ncbi:MAG: hypothetical protein V7637_6387 [Mycobacteriales bacterium]|jgi:hypothetical protein